MAPAEAVRLVAPQDSEDDAQLAGPKKISTRTTIAACLFACAALAATAVMVKGNASESRAPDYSSIVGLSAKGKHKDEKHGNSTKDHAADTKKCSWGKENCNATKCCNNPGAQCYEQGSWYAQCRISCTEGPDPTHWDGNAWTCKELGDRTPGEGGCAELGEDCREKGCCSTTNTQCFKKNDDWATCLGECFADGPLLIDSNSDPWSCETVGEWAKGAEDWVAEQCSPEGEDCTASQCCVSPGMQCFRQSDFWAQCMYDCQAGVAQPEQPWGPEWSCDTLGSRTPGAGGVPSQKVSDWVPKTCAGEGEDCSKSKCCLLTNTQCYEKNKDWGLCMSDCAAGNHSDDNNEAWSCKPLGPRLSSGLALKGSPSIFCWSLFQTTSYEMGIMKLQMKQDAGIFQCDDYALLSTDEETSLGETADGVEVKTMKVEKAEITTSVDGTAGNAKLFINTWNVIIADGRWKRHAWIIKVDPDAVIVPYRVRDHLRDHVLENVYVVNCNKFPSSPNFPMMYGSVEIYSFLAIDTYAAKIDSCMDDMGMMLPQWGEDYFMTHCLDHIGVGRISDFVSVGDNVCTGGSCADGAFSAFHPFKDEASWQECWDEVNGKAPPPPEWA